MRGRWIYVPPQFFDEVRHSLAGGMDNARLMRENEKLREQGYLTIAGRLPRRYFESLIADGRSPGHDRKTENIRG